jgi:hypothetical protein
LVSAALTVSYGLHGYARPYVPAQWLNFTEENLRRFLIACVAAPLVAIAAGLTRRRRRR